MSEHLGDHYRTLPIVPGINAGILRPSIGLDLKTDRLSSGQSAKILTRSATFRVRPLAGGPNRDTVTVKASGHVGTPTRKPKRATKSRSSLPRKDR